jgi:hypothetical protein
MDGYYFPPRQNKLLWEMSEQIRKKWSQYYKRPQMSHVLSWWTVLKACNKSHLPIFLHLSTYLCYPNLHLLEVMDLIHGSPLLGNSNHQTLSICYSGSIEKIKLLGVLYWLPEKKLANHGLL